MQISALEEYGLRCALQLAMLKEDQTLAASQIAEREGISIRYASKILHLLKKSGMIAAQRGKQGGFKLTKGANTITVKEVFVSVRGRADKDNFCEQYKGLHSECIHFGACSVRPVWQILVGYFDGVLERISLADLVLTEESSRQKIEVFARAEAERLRVMFAEKGNAHVRNS